MDDLTAVQFTWGWAAVWCIFIQWFLYLGIEARPQGHFMRAGAFSGLKY